MKTNTKIAIGVVTIVLAINFVVVPAVTRNKARTVAKRVLDYWKINDSASGLKYFQNPDTFPPIYDLQSYEITKEKFEKIDGELRAKFWVVMHFLPTNVLPSGRTWYCELRGAKRGWKVAAFHIDH